MPVKTYWMHNVKYISLLFSTLNPTTISDSANNVANISPQSKTKQSLTHSCTTAHPITTAQVSTGPGQ